MESVITALLELKTLLEEIYVTSSFCGKREVMHYKSNRSASGKRKSWYPKRCWQSHKVYMPKAPSYTSNNDSNDQKKIGITRLSFCVETASRTPAAIVAMRYFEI